MFFMPGCPCCGSGDFYVVDGFTNGQYKLYTLTQAGVMTAVGSLGIPASGGEPGGLSGIDYDASDNLVGITFGGISGVNQPRIYDVDKTTGAASNSRVISGLTPAGNGAIGLARHPTTGVWYTIYKGVLWTLAIDAVSAVATSVGATGVTMAEGDMAFDPTNDTLYACGGGTLLHTMDLGTGAATPVGANAMPADTSAITFDASGQLWGTESDATVPFTSPDLLNKITKATGAITVITTMTGDELGTVAGMRPIR